MLHRNGDLSASCSQTVSYKALGAQHAHALAGAKKYGTARQFFSHKHSPQWSGKASFVCLSLFSG
eukprot:1160932-Pelagomonas_calceolata.AAC.1